MLGSYLSPLAPAAVLLLSAFILFGIGLWLPKRWQMWAGLKYFNAPLLVAVALLTLLGVPLVSGTDPTGKGLTVLSGWNFSTTNSVAALSVRVDSLSLPFLLVMLMLLLAITLLQRDLQQNHRELGRVAGWLLLASSACFLFVAANGLTVLYALVAFDVLTGVYWLARGHRNTAVARLFLGAFSTAGVVLFTLIPAAEVVWPQMILGGVLWLRLGLYPLVEASVSQNWRNDERLAGLGISLTAGIYLAVRVLSRPLPPAIRWLVVLTMLAGGVWVWLRQSPGKSRTLRLSWLFITQALLLLLVAPLSSEIISAFVVGMVLSIVALWVTPALGVPRFSEGAWSWPYLPAALATLTLVGAPLSLGWVARTAAYESIFEGDTLLLLLLVLAEALAFSNLVPYWQRLVGGSEQNLRRSVIGIVVMVPFLTPGLSPFVLEAVTRATLPGFAVGELGGVVVAALVGVVALAAAFGYFRALLLDRLPWLAQLSAARFTVGQGLDALVAMFDAGTKRLLRLQVIFEGRHYISWAILTALVGLIVILLS